MVHGSANIPSFKLNELMASKLRALFQRRKGRDLFDLWFTLTREMIEPDKVISCFDKYTELLDTPITRARFEKNLSEKFEDRLFIEDLEPLISRDFGYDVESAIQVVYENLVKNLPGKPYQGDDSIFIEPGIN